MADNVQHFVLIDHVVFLHVWRNGKRRDNTWIMITTHVDRNTTNWLMMDTCTAWRYQLASHLSLVFVDCRGVHSMGACHPGSQRIARSWTVASWQSLARYTPHAGKRRVRSQREVTAVMRWATVHWFCSRFGHPPCGLHGEQIQRSSFTGWSLDGSSVESSVGH